jgi:AsmA protein
MNRKGMKITAIATAAVLVILVALPYIVDVDRFRPQLESSLASSLGRDVHIGHMDLSLLAGGARVEQISVADDPSFREGNFLEAKSLGVGISFLSLIFTRSLHVTSLTVEEPHMTLVQSDEGKWNFSTLGTGKNDNDDEDSATSALFADASAKSVVLDNLKISKATIDVATSGHESQPTVLKNIDVNLKNVSYDSAMTFLLSAHTDGGKLEIRGDAGPVNSANSAQTPFHATIKADKANLAEIASLGSSSNLSGLLNLNATLSSDGNTMRSEGKARVEKLRVAHGAQPANQGLSLQYSTEYDIAAKTGVVNNSEIRAGAGAAVLSGTYEEHGENLALHMKIAGKNMALDSVVQILPALGISLPGGSKLHGGTVSANLSLDGPVSRIATSGNVQIANAHLSGFDLGSKMKSWPGVSSAIKSGTEISIVSLGSNLHITPATIHVSGFKGEFDEIGTITGEGDIKSDNHLDFKMVANVASDGALRFGLDHIGLKRVPNEIPFEVVGTTSVPILIPDAGAMGKKTAKLAAASAGKRLMEKMTSAAVKNPTTAANESKPSNEPKVQASNKKGGFFHNLFRHKGKDRKNESDSPQMAAQKAKM